MAPIARVASMGGSRSGPLGRGLGKAGARAQIDSCRRMQVLTPQRFASLCRKVRAVARFLADDGNPSKPRKSVDGNLRLGRRVVARRLLRVWRGRAYLCTPARVGVAPAGGTPTRNIHCMGLLHYTDRWDSRGLAFRIMPQSPHFATLGG